MNLTYITKHLNTHEKCVNFLKKKRWSDVPTCAYCGSKKSTPKGLRYTCHTCKNSFSVTVGTVFQNSNLPLQKWLMAISIMMSAKKGVSSLQLARDISVNKNTAWLLQMKIRAAMSEGDLDFFKSDPRSFRVTLTGHFVKSRSGRNSREDTDTRNIERCWSHLKRAIIGQYHRIDERYLFRYVDEILFKYDRRDFSDGGHSELLNRVLSI